MLESRVRLAVVSLVTTVVIANITGCMNPPQGHSTPASAGGVLALGENPSVNVPSLSLAETDKLERMTDANILSRLCFTDSLEIEMAKVARARSGSVGVRDYARQLIADHSMSLQHDRMISTHRDVTMQFVPGDTSSLMGFRELDSLRTSVPASDFDRRFLTSQIATHGHLIAQLQTLQRVAHDRALRDQITNQIAVAQKHLMRAQWLARDAGYVNAGN